MSVLVAAASRYGATAEIAGAIGEGLERAGLDVTVASVDDVSSLDGYEAVVLGQRGLCRTVVEGGPQVREAQSERALGNPGVALFQRTHR